MSFSTFKKIGLLTSGGDAPGMNAAIRAIVRSAINFKISVVGIRRGYEGLLAADIKHLKGGDVSDIIHRGGTMLRTARCPEMLTEQGLKRASQVCKVLGLDCLIVIGGDGSLKGAANLAKLGVNVIGIPATIDLDLNCSEYTIGFDTAVNTGMDAINKLRDTSGSHERCSVVEVMGRGAGALALWCGMAGGAEEMVIPENEGMTAEDVIRQIIENRAKGRRHHVVLVAEGAGERTFDLSKKIEQVTGIESRATILGHLQRGGDPTALDRMHASVMGFNAVELFTNNVLNRVVVIKNGQYSDVDIFEALKEQKKYDPKLYEIIKTIAV